MSGLVDTILNHTALPNLHPAVVHFPIALFPLSIAFDLVVVGGALAGRRSLVERLDGVTATLYTLAALAAGAAVWAGERAAESLTGLPEPVNELVHEHEEWAEWFLYAAIGLALARLSVGWWQRRRDGGPASGLVLPRAAVVGAALAACYLLVGVADRGGSLVYRSGVAVMAVEASEPASSEPEKPHGPDR